MSGTDSKAGGREYLYLFTQAKPIVGEALTEPLSGVWRNAMFRLIWLAVLILDLVALVSLLKSGADTGTKILWVLLIVLLPLVGMILYFLMGPGRKTAV